MMINDREVSWKNIEISSRPASRVSLWSSTIYRRRKGGCGLVVMHGRSRMAMDPTSLYNAETEHVGFSPTR